MALRVKTVNPDELKQRIIQRINETFVFTSDGAGDITLCGDYRERAWLSPITQNDELIWGIIGRRDQKMTKFIYALFFCKLAEFILTNYDDVIESIEITTQPMAEIDAFL